MKYLKSAASGGIVGLRWLLIVVAYGLESAAEGLVWVSDRLDGLRDTVRR